jgi:signal transduction histidine kinase
VKENLPRSIVASAVFSVVLAALLVILGGLLIRPALQRVVLSSMMRVVDLDACANEPASFGRGEEGLSMYGYDRNGRSAHPDAPTIEVELLERALETGEMAAREADGKLTAVLPQGADGSCAVLRVSFGRLAWIARTKLFGVLAVSTLGGMVLAAAGTFLLVVLPLRRRIESLARSAGGVGTEAFTSQPVSPDSLGTIADVLTQTHRRVIESQDALEQRNRALEDHLAGIAHDLRTPLASLQLALESLDESAEASRALGDAVYLSSLVENLHQGARLRHALDVTAGRVELGDLVRRLERRFAVVGRHAGVEVAASVPEGEVWTACTPALAERAIANLVQNAVEHNDVTGHVAVTLETTEDGTFSLLVADDGPGLPESTLASLSAPTFLTEAARRRGPGLGMLITAEVARRAGWSVVHESLEPRGLRVTLTGALTRAQA